MPELQHVCFLFSKVFGREFVCAATELRNSCGVNDCAEAVHKAAEPGEQGEDHQGNRGRGRDSSGYWS